MRSECSAQTCIGQAPYFELLRWRTTEGQRAACCKLQLVTAAQLEPRKKRLHFRAGFFQLSHAVENRPLLHWSIRAQAIQSSVFMPHVAFGRL